MIALASIAWETFLRLRRDRIFLPAALIGGGLLSFSGLASYWGIEEFFKILYDLGTSAYLFTGTTVAIFWGHKIIADSKQEGSLEVQLASPVSRSTWLLGKFLGLLGGLLTLAFILMIAWQAIYLSYGIGWLPPQVLVIFLLLTLSWVVMGAVAIFFASITQGAIALFCSIWVFIIGLLSAPIMQSLAPDTPPLTRQAVELLAGLWNLHSFNLGTYVGTSQFVSQLELFSRAGYGFLLLGFFLSLACFFFQRKDIVA